jgi:hypothetical protein
LRRQHRQRAREPIVRHPAAGTIRGYDTSCRKRGRRRQLHLRRTTTVRPAVSGDASMGTGRDLFDSASSMCADPMGMGYCPPIGSAQSLPTLLSLQSTHSECTGGAPRCPGPPPASRGRGGARSSTPCGAALRCVCSLPLRAPAPPSPAPRVPRLPPRPRHPPPPYPTLSPSLTTSQVLPPPCPRRLHLPSRRPPSPP